MFQSGVQSNTAEAPGLDPERLRSLAPVERRRGRNLSKADVLFYDLDGEAVVVKDYSARPFLARHTAGRWLIAREARAYRAARGIAGLPEFLGRLGPFAIALRRVEGVPLAALARGRVEPEFFGRLGTILEALHERGIALGDLHHRDVLVGPAGEASIVDLATAWVAGQRAGALRRAVYRRLSGLDRVALARMRARFTGESEAELVLAQAGPAALRLHRRGRLVKRLWDRLRGKT